MTLRYHMTGDLDAMSAVEDILSRYEDDVLKGQEIRQWLHRLVNLAAEADDSSDCVVMEDLFYPGDGTHTCEPACEGGCADVRRQARATCAVTIPGGASLMA